MHYLRIHSKNWECGQHADSQIFAYYSLDTAHCLFSGNIWLFTIQSMILKYLEPDDELFVFWYAVSSCFFATVTTPVYLIVKCYQNNSWYDGWIKAIKAQALLKAPTLPHKNEEESEGWGTSSSLILIGYTHIPQQHVGDGAGVPCWEC